MPETDKLLLGLMAGKDRKVLFAKAGVPAAFAHIECCLWHPFFPANEELLSLTSKGFWKHLRSCSGNGKASWPENGILICLG